jgi:rubrerythrin
MEHLNSINGILDFAIEQEQIAADFYNNIAKKSATGEMQAVFQGFAKEEMGHKAKLINIKEKGTYTLTANKILDLRMSDFIDTTQPRSDMTYQDILKIAMHREKAAFKLYIILSTKAPNEELKNVFLMLAQEEAKHKLRFEIEYDEYVLNEN